MRWLVLRFIRAELLLLEGRRGLRDDAGCGALLCVRRRRGDPVVKRMTELELWLME